MNKLLNGTASTAMTLAGDAASRLKNSVTHWVPQAIKVVGAGANLVVLRKGGQKLAGAVRRNPVTTVATVTVAAGAGVALWLLRRNKARRAVDEAMRVEPVEIQATRKPAKRAPRKTSARKVTASTTAST